MVDTNDARLRVLDAAERLFAQKGYSAVSVRDIAAAIGIHHTTLYHHVPGGKEQLFLEVIERNFRHHHAGLTHALTHAGPDIRIQLRAAAEWLLSQPPMDQVRLVYSDMPSLDPIQADRLSNIAYETLFLPLESVLRVAQQRGNIGPHDLSLVAGAFIGMIESLYAVPQYPGMKSRHTMAYEVIDILLTGLYPRENEGKHL